MEQRDDAPSPSSSSPSLDESGANSHMQSGFDGNGAPPGMPPEEAQVLANIIGQLGVLEDEAKTSSVKRGIADQRQKLSAFMRKRFRKVVTGDETKRVRDHIREPPVARSIDKWAFTFGVFMLTMTEFLLIKYPSQFWAYYMVVIPFLVFIRIPHYRSLKWEFFMLDFCYYTQVLCILLLFAYPKSCRFFKAIFLLSTGPLACSVPAWRNSLVFHDLEKITSIYIHVFPALLLYSIRWYQPTDGSGWGPCLDACGALEGKDLGHALLLYVMWQVMYFVKVEMVEKAKLDADPELLTSLRWLAQDKKNALHQLVLLLTRRWGVLEVDELFDHKTLKTKAIFIITQFVYTLATCVPALLVYTRHPLHVAYGLSIFLAGIYNGATYYIEVFSVRYASKYPHERPAGLGAERSRKRAETAPPSAPPEMRKSVSEGGGSNRGPTGDGSTTAGAKKAN